MWVTVTFRYSRVITRLLVVKAASGNNHVTLLCDMNV